MIEPTQPGAYYYSGTLPEIPIPPPPPPPPPEYYMQQKTGKLWKAVIPIVILLFGGIVGIFFYPVLNAFINPSATSPTKPTPYAPLSLQPTITPQVSYLNDMDSLNYRRLIPTWRQALSYKDWQTVSEHIATQDFETICIADSPCNTSDWPTTKGALENGDLQLSIAESYKLVTSDCSDLDNFGPRIIDEGRPLYVRGTFNNNYQQSGISSATPSGPAIFQFVQYTSFSVAQGVKLPTILLGTMVLEAVYLNAHC